MDDTGKIIHGEGNNKEADYLTSVVTVKTLDVDSRKEKLDKLPIEERTTLKWPSKDKFLQFLLENHQIFALDEAERGEINLVQITINTGEGECINSGLDYWNGGLEGFVLVFIICHVVSIYFVVLADLCYSFYVAGFPDSEGY